MNNKEVCWECGIKYLTEEQKQMKGFAITFSMGKCCECKEIKEVTDTRNYNYLKKIK